MPSVNSAETDHLRANTSLLLYDGNCGLCNAVVRLLLRIDRRKKLCFAALQGETGQAFLRAHGLDSENFDSLVFIPDRTRTSEFFLRTDAVLRILNHLGGVWRVFSWLRIVPARWRDPAYRLVARFRYRLFGEYRPRPLEPEWIARFLP